VERLWTPWRRTYLEGGDSHATGCFLCAHAGDADHDRENLVVFRAPLAFVLLNLYPYNSGHLLVAPYAHTGDFAGLDPEVASGLMQATQRAVDALHRVYAPNGFNVGMNLGKSAGAGVPDHLHVHVVPRWDGDTNFMPVVGETKVLPETLEQTRERLAGVFEENRNQNSEIS
jgi:ATP adenylyltransferase